MRQRAMIAAALIAFGAAGACAEPVSEEALGEIYESCVTSALGTSAAARMRYCYCLRDEVQRNFTAEELAGARERLAANTLTEADHERRERVSEACRGAMDGQ